MGAHRRRCGSRGKSSFHWRMKKTCQQSCFDAGNGYDGDQCCPVDYVAPAPAPNPPPQIPTATKFMWQIEEDAANPLQPDHFVTGYAYIEPFVKFEVEADDSEIEKEWEKTIVVFSVPVTPLGAFFVLA